MKKFVGCWVLYLGTTLCAFSQVDTSYIFNTNMPFGTVDLRLAKSPTRYYYLQEGITFSYRESSPGVKTNTYLRMTTWNTSAYGEGNLREVNGDRDDFVMNYRLLKPKNYNETYSPGYPIIIMFHGGGEAANCWIDERCVWATASYNPVTNDPPAPTDANHRLLNNDRNLLHGGIQHLNAVNLAGSKLPNDPSLAPRAFPGFVLFPQSLNGWGPTSMVHDALRILRLIIKKYNIDQNRVYVHGLSNGGAGVYQALQRAPWLFAAALPMSAVNDAGITNNGMAAEVGKLPLWIFQGGQDNNPTPGRTYNYVRRFRDAGATVRYYMYPHLGHGTWNTAYNEPDFFSWMLSKRKYNPHVFYGNPVICNTTQTGVRLGFSKGFFAYQWQRDGQTIQGENGAELIAITPGTYRGRFSRKPNPTESDWEPWSDPIVVNEMYPSKPVVDVIGTTHLRGPGLPSTNENNTVQLRSAQSAELYNWYRNGEPVDFVETAIEDTLRLATFTHGSSGNNGAYTLVVKTANCPSPPSDPVNLFFNNSSPQNISIAAGPLNLKGTVTASSIFISWNDVASVETGYELWRRKAGSQDFKFVTKTRENAISYQDTDVDPGTTYEYKIRAVNNDARSNYLPSDDLAVNYEFTTSGDFHFPPPPQELKVVSNSLTTISLSWKASNDESSVKEYYIYYGDNSISTGNNATTFTLTGLKANTAFPITVKAVDHANHFSQASNQIIATTYLTGLEYKHSTGAWESLDDSAMVATWKSPEFTGVVPNFTLEPRTQHDYFNFQFTGYLDIRTAGTYFFSITSDDGSRLILDGNVIADNDGLHGSRTITSDSIFLTAGPHPIEVQYFDDVAGHTLTVRYKGPGIGDGTNFVTIPNVALRSGTYDPPPSPAPPSGLTANGVGMERIDIDWNFQDNDGTDYEVYRATATQGPFQIVARAKGTSASDSIGLIPNTRYYYKVRTVNQNGSSGFSAVVSATTRADNEVPTVPTEIVEISKTLTTLALTWKPSSDNVGVTGYEIFSGDELIGTSDIHAFMAEDLEPNTQYTVTVKAVDASGNRSPASAPLIVITTNGTVFYSLATGNLNELSTWHTNSDGSGASPANFSDDGQYFMVMNRTSTSLGGPWNVGGPSSLVIIPTGVTLTAEDAFSARVDLQGTATINLNHASAPELVKLSPASTVNFNVPPLISGNTFGNLVLSGTTAKTFAADTIIVMGNLTVHEGLALEGAPDNGSHIRMGGNIVLNGTRPVTPAENAVDIAFTGTKPQSVITGSDLHLYRIITSPNTDVDVSASGDVPVKLHVGAPKGGGLLLSNGSQLSLGKNNLVVQHAGVINPDNQGGRISINGSDIHITSASDQNMNLYFDPSLHLVHHFNIDLTGTGIVTLREPMHISKSLKVQNGTLAAGGYITLLSSADSTALIEEIGDTGKITGDVIVQQHLPPMGTVYHYLSTPVNGVTVAKWQSSFPVTGKFSGASKGSGLSDNPSLYLFRNGRWVAHPPSGGSNTAPIEKTRGYAALLRNENNPITLQVKGNPFQGTIPFALEAGGGNVDKGWNLVGNPYAAPIVWDGNAEAWTHLGINNVIAVRKNTTVNGQTRSQVTYYDRLLGGGVIGAGEAFWIKTFGEAPALSIHEKAKINPGEPVEQTTDVGHLIVNLRQGDITDPAYILFTNSATDKYDDLYDGRKIENYGMFNLSTIAGDTMLLAVNNLANEFCTKTVKLNLADVAPGSYALSFENIASLTDVGQIVFTDHFAGSSTNVTTGEEYTFSVTSEPATFGPNRFSLAFHKTALDTTTPKLSTIESCSPGPGYVSIVNSQAGAVYQAINAAGKIISPEGTGNGKTIVLEVVPGELSIGPNQIRVSARISGCERQILPGSVSLNYLSEFPVVTEAEVSVCEGGQAVLEASGAPAGGFYRWYDANGEVVQGANTATFVVAEVFSEAVYYVSTAHPNGCESKRQEIHISTVVLDTPAIVMKDDTLFTGDVGSYQWKRQGRPLPDGTLNYYLPVYNGDYTVESSSGGCVLESEPYFFGDGITGIEDEQHPEFVLSIYPVPTSGHSLKVSLQSPANDPVLIEIIDTMGRLHFSGSFNAIALGDGVNIVPSAPLYNGLYFVRVTQAARKALRRIIVTD